MKESTAMSTLSGKKHFYVFLTALTLVVIFSLLSVFRVSVIPLPPIIQAQTSRLFHITSHGASDFVDTSNDPLSDVVKGTAVTMKEIDDNFKRCAREAMNKYNGTCVQVWKNSTSFWRSSGKAGKTRDEDYERMNLASQCCAFNHTELMTYDPRDPMFPWEREYLSQPPLYNMADTAWANSSTVSLINPGKNSLVVGDTVHFLIVLRNGRGERRKMGGDSVRLWLFNDDLGAAIAADVTDNYDGSYIATVLLPWSGKVKVNATIAHTRELFRASFYVQRMFKMTHWITGGFYSGKSSEATPCMPHPSIPGFSWPEEVCNLTEQNGGYPWYCGKPVKSHILNCSHWETSKKLQVPSYFPLTEAEEELLLITETKRPFLIPNDIVLKVQPAIENQVTLRPPNIRCNKRQLSETFEDTNLSGYFYAKKWRPLACQLPTVDRRFLLKCLKNTQMIIIGDSNSRAQMDNLKSLLQCKDKINRTKVVWHSKLQCDIDELNISVKYFPPKQPFYGSMTEHMLNTNLHSPVHIIDSIPSQGKYFVLVHDFLHILGAHLSVAEQRLRLLRQAIARLLARNPRAIVMFQSAHIAYDRTSHNRHKLNVFVLELQRTLLKGLGDRVMFVLTWPITVAVANTEHHPSSLTEFTKLYMGYVCMR